MNEDVRFGPQGLPDAVLVQKANALARKIMGHSDNNISERLDRMEADQRTTAAKVAEIHSALLGCLEDGTVGLIGRVDRHSRDIGEMRETDRRRSGWVATGVVGSAVALIAAGLAAIRERF